MGDEIACEGSEQGESTANTADLMIREILGVR